MKDRRLLVIASAAPINLTESDSGHKQKTILKFVDNRIWQKNSTVQRVCCVAQGLGICQFTQTSTIFSMR